MKYKLTVTVSGNDDRVLEDFNQLKESILCGDFQREMSRRSKIEDPYCKVIATIEEL